MVGRTVSVGNESPEKNTKLQESYKHNFEMHT